LLFFVTTFADPSLPLYNAAVPGTRMPAVGLGTGGYGEKGNIGAEFWDDDVCREATISWLNMGGVRIDSANNYGNEDGLREGILISRRPRESLFITSKTGPGLPLGYFETLQQTDDILKTLNTSYVDLLLLHWPGEFHTVNWSCAENQSFKKCRQDSWRALEVAFKAGKALAIGVSNFEKDHLEDIFELGSLIPSVNQVEYNPYFHEDDLVEFCKAHKILFNGYSSVGCPDFMSSNNNENPHPWKTQIIQQPTVLNIAQKYNKTPAQVVLAWSWQQGIVVNARSWDPEHHLENLNIFDFQLTAEEITAIGAVPKPPNTKISPDPNIIN